MSSIGEATCGNTRCAYHVPQSERPVPKLLTLEVPFAYTEAGERKTALVKLVLCERCENKLMWKRRKEKERKERLACEETEDADYNLGDKLGSAIQTKPQHRPQSRSPKRSKKPSRHAHEFTMEGIDNHDDNVEAHHHRERNLSRRDGKRHERRSASPLGRN